MNAPRLALELGIAAAYAAAVLGAEDRLAMAVGLAPLSVERAVVELDTLLSAQWKNGMIPHIVFANGVDGYFPGPARWAVSELAAHAPVQVQTSGITQPPVHAIAVQRILEHSRRHGRSTRAVAEEFLDRRWADLVRWHRWLAHARDLDGNGRKDLLLVRANGTLAAWIR